MDPEQREHALLQRGGHVLEGLDVVASEFEDAAVGEVGEPQDLLPSG